MHYDIYKRFLLFEGFSQLFLDGTFRESIPDLQPVVATEHSSRRIGVLLQVKTFKLQDNLRHLRCKDDVGTLQAVGVFFREPRGLYHSSRCCIVLRTFGTYEQETKEHHENFSTAQIVRGEGRGFLGEVHHSHRHPCQALLSHSLTSTDVVS